MVKQFNGLQSNAFGNERKRYEKSKKRVEKTIESRSHIALIAKMTKKRNKQKEGGSEIIKMEKRPNKVNQRRKEDEDEEEEES